MRESCEYMWTRRYKPHHMFNLFMYILVFVRTYFENEKGLLTHILRKILRQDSSID